jgi:hypothetical protein
MVDCVSLSVISLPYLGWKVVVGAAAAAIVSPNYRLSVGYVEACSLANSDRLRCIDHGNYGPLFLIDPQA